jgi:uncharacterized Zn finger protein
LIECEYCGEELNVNPVEKPDIDWLKVVCSECGRITEISMVRYSREVEDTK